MTNFVDSHCHFDFAVFDGIRDSIWQACKKSGVNILVVPGVSPEQWPKAVQLTEQYQGMWFAAGIHPWWIEKIFSSGITQQLLEEKRIQLASALTLQKCVAVGECGLDANIALSMPEQQKILEVHLALACELAMPVIIHCYKAHNELLVLLKKYPLTRGGVIHGFSGSIDLAISYWRLGFRLGIGGTITYERAQKTRATVKQLPMDALLLETDAPDMPLFLRQGQINSPDIIPVIAQTLADIRGISLDEVAVRTTANAQLLFGLEP